MNLPPISARLGLLLALASPAAWPASGQITHFGASALEVRAGTVVDFSVDFSVFTSGTQWGGSNLIEPAPQEGYQTWDLNWYYYEAETVGQVWVSGGGQGFGDAPNLGPNSSYANSWSFSMLFDTPGSHQVTVDGGWAGQYENYYSGESAYRDCWNIDPGGTDELQCSSWTYQASDYGDWYSIGDSFAPVSLTIEVSAVPEPATAALWLAGIAVLAAARRRRRVRAALTAGVKSPAGLREASRPFRAVSSALSPRA